MPFTDFSIALFLSQPFVLQPPPDTSSLYVELSKLQQAQDFEKGIKVCNKILNLTPSDVTAFHCKIVCMVQTAKFQDALKQIEDTHFKVDLVSDT